MSERIPDIDSQVLRAMYRLEGYGFSLGGEHGHSFDCLMRDLWKALEEAEDDDIH